MEGAGGGAGVVWGGGAGVVAVWVWGAGVVVVWGGGRGAGVVVVWVWGAGVVAVWGAVAMRVGSLFSGIGGFDLGLERAGFEIVWQVEIDEYCRNVLAKHWPAVPRHADIKDIDWRDIPPVDLVCGGFPCQPFSHAGKRKGKDDDRYLWPEVVRCLETVRPTWFIGENVPGIINMALEQACTDLEGIGYDVWPVVIPACAVDAPHKRDRIWIVAYAECSGPQRYGRERQLGKGSEEVKVSRGGNVANIEPERWVTESRSQHHQWLPEPAVGRVAHGLSGKLDGGGLDGNEDEERAPWPAEPAGVPRVATGVKKRVDRLKGLGTLPRMAGTTTNSRK